MSSVKHKLFLLIFVITAFATSVRAQDHKKDSINQLISADVHDTVKADLYIQLAELYKASDPSFAFSCTDSAEIYLNLSENIRLRGQLHYARGFYYEMIGEFESAVSEIDTAEIYFKNAADLSGYGKSLLRKGILYEYTGNYPKSMEYAQKALILAETLKDSVLMASAYTSLGTVFDYQKDYESAVKFHTAALEIAKSLGLRSQISVSYNNLGIVNQMTGNYERSLEYYELALSLAKEDNNEHRICYTQNDIACVLFEMNRFNEAQEYFAESLKLARKTDDRIMIAYIYAGMGEVFFAQKQYHKALNYMEDAYKIAAETGDQELVVFTSKYLSEGFEILGQTNKALAYFKTYKQTDDNLRNEEITRKVTSMEYEYKMQKEKERQAIENEKRNALHASEIKQRQIIIYAVSGGFILMLVMVFVVYRSYIRKRKDNYLLSQKNEEINQQKEEIQSQAESLSAVNVTLTKQKDHIERAHKHIRESITYASRIQKALLPKQKQFDENLPDHFVLYKPKDIVSGDFYYIKKVEEQLIIVAADCTGHGVPGAFMSMLGIAFLNEIVRKKEITTAAHILEELREHVKSSLKQTGKQEENKDGMDLALCVINTRTHDMQYAGAFNPIYIIRNNDLLVTEADRNPIGVYLKEKPFINHVIPLKENDKIYMFSDGYIDQFGGAKDKKFLDKRFRELLLSIADEPFNKQKSILDRSIENWKAGRKQNDDILVMGFKPFSS